MSTKTSIEWARNSDGTEGRTWNPVVGCNKVSEGCGLPRFEGDKSGGCYAENIARRFAGSKAFPNGFAVTLRPERLNDPLKWRNPTRVFVNSMSDLFHDRVPDAYIARVFAVMTASPQHEYMILTKRHARMRSLLRSPVFSKTVWRAWVDLSLETQGTRMQPDPDAWVKTGARLGACSSSDPMPALPNVLLGVSCEDQHWAQVRIPALLETPAACRFISAEPLLGPIDLRNLKTRGVLIDALGGDVKTTQGEIYTSTPSVLDLVIVGAESGSGARDMELGWVRSLRDQVTSASEVAFFFKQAAVRGKKVPTPELDGRVWVQMPQVREVSA